MRDVTRSPVLAILSVDRALRVLELLVSEREGLRITDLARSIGVNKAIAFRLVNALADLGYVRQDPLSERYEATFKIAALGLRRLDTARISEWAQATLDALAATTQELVRLAVGEARTLRWIAKSQGSNSRLIVDPASGADVVLHTTATGKAWLSTLDLDEAMQIVIDSGLPALTRHTHTDLAVIRSELEEVRRLGYAMTFEEMDEGINAIACPVAPAGSTGHLVPAVGVISVAGPAYRLDRDALVGFVTPLRRAADELSAMWRVHLHAESVA